MAVAPAIGFAELILIPLLCLGGGFLPGGVPPLPEDPALMHVVPADALLAIEWFGSKEPNPQSANATERLAANPEIKALLTRIFEGVQKSARTDAPPEVAQMVKTGVDLLTLVSARPGCIFVAGVEVPPAQPTVNAAVVVNIGDKAAEAGRILRDLENFVLDQLASGGQRPAVLTNDIGGVSFRALPLPPPVPPVAWGLSNSYLIVAVGTGTPDRVLAGLKSNAGLAASPAFKKLQASVRTEAPVSRTYINVEAIVGKVVAVAGMQAAGVVNAIGLSSIQAIIAETGMEGPGMASKSFVATKGVPAGILRLLEGAPLAETDLAPIPLDATIAGAFRLNLETVYNEFLTSLSTIDPRARDEFLREVPRGLEQELGLSLTDDILRPLGDVWCVWSAPSEGGLLFTGLTLAVTVKDRERFQRTLDKIVDLIRREGGTPRQGGDRRPARGAYVASTSAGGTTIQYLNVIGEEFPVAPAWCLTEKRFYISLFPQMLKASLARGAAAETSIAKHPALKDRGGALAVAYVDTLTVFRTVYPLLHPLAQVLCSQIQREGFDIAIDALPTAAGILPHLLPEVTTVTRTDDGILSITRGTTPVGLPVLGLLAPASALLGFRVAHAQTVQTAVRRDQAATSAEPAKTKPAPKNPPPSTEPPKGKAVKEPVKKTAPKAAPKPAPRPAPAPKPAPVEEPAPVESR